MTTLTLTLFGPPRIALDDNPLSLRLRKEVALLTYLAVEQQHPHSRGTLVGLLWPDLPEEAARNNLRVALANLRRALGDTAGAYILADRHCVQFNRTGAYRLDVARFRDLLSNVAGHRHDNGVERCELCLARLREASELYGGELLAGFSLPGRGAFDEWANVRRGQLHQEALGALETLAAAHELRGDLAGQVAYARRLLALEPWRETAHAHLMRGLWAAGQRGAALVQYDLCRHILATELGLAPSPELSALAAQLRSADGRGAMASDLAATPRSSAARPVLEAEQEPGLAHNLPAALTPLVGRDEELARLEAIFGRPGCRLVTLTGPGGIGKTTLALELARRRLRDYRDGAFLVELAPLHRSEDVAAMIVQAVGAKVRGGQTLAAALALWLRERHLLLVLDNFEHLLASASLVAELLAAAPGLAVLATSREALGLYGEQHFPVPPLALPPATAGGATGQGIGEYAAVALFVQRLQAVRPEFALTAENAPAIAALCARLDGLPLALELAAARGQRMSPQRILEHLRQGGAALQLLSDGRRGRYPRQQTMHAAIAWSYELLNPAEQALFRRLAVFAGDWDEDTAGTIAAASEQLYALVDKNLIVLHEGADQSKPRYTMLETIREYALEQLEARGEAKATRRAHAEHFVALAEEAEPLLVGADEWRWMSRLTEEEHNLRAALRWCIDQGEITLGLRLGAALAPYWDPRGLYTEGFNWLRELLALDASAEAGEVYLRARARALQVAALYSFWKGEMELAEALVAESLGLSRACGDERSEARALMTLGNVVGIGLGLPRAAIPCYQEALTIQLRLDNQHGVGITYYNLGLVTLIDGDYERSEACFKRAIKVFTTLSSDSWLRHIMPYHAAPILLAGDPERAARMLAPVLVWDTAADELTLLALAQTLLVAAILAGMSRSSLVAARLVGMVDAITEEAGVAIEKRGDCRLLHTRAAALALSLLSEDTFAAARAEGRAMLIDQARHEARAVVNALLTRV